MQTGFESEPLKVSTFDGHNFVGMDYFYWRWNGKRYRSIIGATSDLASTPQISWDMLPPFGWYARAAWAHDAAYRANLEVQIEYGTWLRIQMPFADANQMLLDLMTSCQTSPFQDGDKFTIYQAVSKAGQKSFSDDLAKPIV